MVSGEKNYNIIIDRKIIILDIPQILLGEVILHFQRFAK